MNIDVKIHSVRMDDGPTRALASVSLDNCFMIRNVKVVDGKKGLFVSLPSFKAGNGEYKDICFPSTKEIREKFNAAVLEAYDQKLNQVQDVPAISLAEI